MFPSPFLKVSSLLLEKFMFKDVLTFGLFKECFLFWSVSVFKKKRRFIELFWEGQTWKVLKLASCLVALSTC